MEDEQLFGELFERRIVDAMGRYRSALSKVRKAIDAFNLAKSDVDMLTGARAVISRGTNRAYIKPELVSVELVESVEVEVPVKVRRGKTTTKKPEKTAEGRKGKALDFSLDTKAGILRNTLYALEEGVDIDAIFDKLPATTKPELQISKGDLFRMLPRFVGRGEMVKVGRTYWRPEHVPESAYEHSLFFAGEDQDV
ncbi:MAG TPA: hypothetical protein VK612_11655 [Pyrinomonadaceae bacterium]|nr:hypothetical protein [Pyrinomonadaceae bacterium]